MSTVTFSGTGELTKSTVRANVGSATIVVIEGYSSIGARAFHENHQITSVTILNSVTSIDNGAFQECTALISITIGSGVTSIGNRAFAYCDSLTTVYIANNQASITEGDEANGEIETTTVINSPATGVTFFGTTFNISLPVQPVQPAPVITSVTTSSGTATINFTQSSNTEVPAITSYEYSTDSGTTWVPVSETSSPITLNGLTDGTTYNFTIRNYTGF